MMETPANYEVLSLNQFREIYFNVLESIFRHWSPDMQDEIAAHCYGWKTQNFDFKEYLQQSVVRYYKAYTTLTSISEGRDICDLGGFWGAFPATLSKIGYNVTMTECLKYYSKSFNSLFDQIKEFGVSIIDYDPFSTEVLEKRFDFVTVMAVLEHYPHSPAAFLANIKQIIKPAGYAYFEVPNIAYWPKRINFLKGISPNTPIRDIYLSHTPFVGHHHEYTAAELTELLQLANYQMVRRFSYNYSNSEADILSRLVQKFFPLTRECIVAVCKP